jgi:Fe-S-cluster containining protein
VPIFHECQRCTACCRWPGQVRLSNTEITRLAKFRALSEHDFIQQFTRLSQDRRGLVLQEKTNGECVFLDGNDCAVQPVKPQQCRDFPNLWNFPGFEKTCQAIPQLVSETEFRRLVAQATGRPEHEVGSFPWNLPGSAGDSPASPSLH